MDFAPFCLLKTNKTKELESHLLSQIELSLSRQDMLNNQMIDGVIDWRTEFRPYYNVYPVILESILKTDLSEIKISDIKLPDGLQTLSFRFERSSGRKPFLVCRRNNGLVISEQITDEKANVFARVDGTPLIDVRDRWHETFKIIVGSLMLDTEFVERDMNEKEKDKPLQYFQKVGKVGWNIGKNIEKEAREVGAHYRRPHLAIRWCGKGGETPVLKRIKGAIVNKQKLTEIPTGYEDKEVAGEAHQMSAKINTEQAK